MKGLKNELTIKEQIHRQYCQLINSKLAYLQQLLADLKDSGTNETKSTAGDKHETALAMLQIEQANTRNQLKEWIAQKAALEKIDPSIRHTVISTGSLIKTNRGYLFLSIALGKATVEGIPVIALSPQSPLGMKLTGQTAGACVIMNHYKYLIESIE